MQQICFEYARPFSPPDPLRMDVVCFIGLVHPASDVSVPENVTRFLKINQYDRRAATQVGDNIQWDLTDVPVPVESWEQYTLLFDTGNRLVKPAGIRSEPIGDILTGTEENLLLTLVVDGKVFHVPALDGQTIQDFALRIDTSIEGVHASVEALDNKSRIIIEKDVGKGAGSLAVWSNPVFGFPRPVKDVESQVDTYLSSAVRSFFASGGRRCYVIRMGDPLPFFWDTPQKIPMIAKLFGWPETTVQGVVRFSDFSPPLSSSLSGNIAMPEYRHGLSHLAGLDDVSFVSFPDLPDLFGRVSAMMPQPITTRPPEVFVACSSEIKPMDKGFGSLPFPPECCMEGCLAWAETINHISGFLSELRRDVHLVASVPLPDTDAQDDFPTSVLALVRPDQTDQEYLSRSFVVPVFPWLKTDLSDRLPGAVEPSEGTLLGLLAKGALSKGAYRSIAGTQVPSAIDLYPESTRTRIDLKKKIKGLSQFAMGLNGVVLLSDGTASLDDRLTHGAVSRLFALILRAAKTRGERLVFEPMSENLWMDVENYLKMLMNAIYENGGLKGRDQRAAFQVTCNKSTMTQNDMDNGRLIAHIAFSPAVPVEKIHITLNLTHSANVMILGGTS